MEYNKRNYNSLLNHEELQKNDMTKIEDTIRTDTTITTKTYNDKSFLSREIIKILIHCFNGDNTGRTEELKRGIWRERGNF